MPEVVTFKSVPCVVCGKVTEMELSKFKLEAWQNGMFIQDAFPELSKSEREVLISGVCSDKCWDELWCSCKATGKEECPVHG